MPIHFDRPAFRGRLRILRRDLCGDDGRAIMAANLGISPGSWANYESGVFVPDYILLRLLSLTGIDPGWLLTGDGDPYRAPAKPTIQPI